LLEGSGWYVPDYSYAEPFFWGQGQGCNFLTQACSAIGSNFADFCTTTGAHSCTIPGRTGGYCDPDLRSDGCQFVHPSTSFDCESVSSEGSARLPDLQTFGRGLGSKCFTGTLTTSTTASATTFCFKPICSGSGVNTKLNIHVGTQIIACPAAGPQKVAGYNGVVNCPDPLTFCSTVGQQACPRNCMGQGICVSGVCQCNLGFSGSDCALNA